MDDASADVYAALMFLLPLFRGPGGLLFPGKRKAGEAIGRYSIGFVCPQAQDCIAGNVTDSTLVVPV